MPFLNKDRYLVRVRDVRARLKAHIEMDHPTIVGDPYCARAIIVPLGELHAGFGEEQKKLLAAARKRFRLAMTVLEGL